MSRVIRMLMLLLCSTPLLAAELALDSGQKQNVLIELYTSEGCSSCPPAERYINAFKAREALWNRYIPVAFHVGYWDYIGWKDRYAAPAFEKRQRQHAREGNVRSVYTPALIVNGNALRPGRYGQLPPPTGNRSGTLEVRVSENTLSARYRSAGGGETGLRLHIALLGMGLESRITAGENKGRTSQHEFVVVGFKSVQGRDGQWQTRLPDPHYRDTGPRALAVWVTPGDSLKPLQAVGGYLLP